MGLHGFAPRARAQWLYQQKPTPGEGLCAARAGPMDIPTRRLGGQEVAAMGLKITT